MDKLKQMLNLDGINNQNDLKKRFDDIAKYIFTNIDIHPYNNISTKYNIIEIEFYWNAPYHEDSTTNHRGDNCAAGTIRLFYGGKRERADICFKSDKNSYGGILIRGIKKSNEKDVILGPNRVKNILFSGSEKRFEIDIICEKRPSPIYGYIVKKYRNNIKNQEYDYNYSFAEKDSVIECLK